MNELGFWKRSLAESENSGGYLIGLLNQSFLYFILWFDYFMFNMVSI
jgi:hypothetical protein